MKKPWRYHGECCALGGPAAITLGACGLLGFGLRTSLGTTFTMIPPRLFQIVSHCILQGLLHRVEMQPPAVCAILTLISDLILERPYAGAGAGAGGAGQVQGGAGGGGRLVQGLSLKSRNLILKLYLSVECISGLSKPSSENAI